MEPTQPTPAPYQTPTAPTTPQPMAPSPRMNPAMVAGAVAVLVVVALGAYYMGTRGERVAVSPSPEPVFCTMDAKICPDGSSVGRTGPNCEFTACPGSTSSVPADWKTYTNTELGFELSFPPTWSDMTTRISDGTVYFSAPCSSAESTQNEYFLIASQAITEFEATKQLEIEARGFSSATALGQKNGMQFYAETISGTTCKQADYGTAMMGETSRILSTFKFIEPTSAVPADWKTYTNTELGFEFRYPGTSAYEKPETVRNLDISSSVRIQNYDPKTDALRLRQSEYYLEMSIWLKKGAVVCDYATSDRVALGNNIFGYQSKSSEEGNEAGGPSLTLCIDSPVMLLVSVTQGDTSMILARQILSTFKFTK